MGKGGKENEKESCNGLKERQREEKGVDINCSEVHRCQYYALFYLSNCMKYRDL